MDSFKNEIWTSPFKKFSKLRDNTLHNEGNKGKHLLFVGVSSLDAKASGHMGLRTLLYYFGTTFMAIVIGVILVVSIHPGDPVLKDETAVAEGDSRITSLDALLDLIRFVDYL